MSEREEPVSQTERARAVRTYFEHFSRQELITLKRAWEPALEILDDLPPNLRARAMGPNAFASLIMELERRDEAERFADRSGYAG